MNGIRTVFIANLRYFRKQKGLTQTMLSVPLDKGMNYVASIENGQSFPPPETIDQIAQILGIKPSKLFDENASMENIQNNSRKEFVEEVTAELEKRISKSIRKEMKNLLG